MLSRWQRLKQQLTLSDAARFWLLVAVILVCVLIGWVLIAVIA
jgi:hypothetical protein